MHPRGETLVVGAPAWHSLAMIRLASGLIGTCALVLSVGCGDDGLPEVPGGSTTNADSGSNPTTTPNVTMTTSGNGSTSDDPDTTAATDPSEGDTTAADSTAGESGTTGGTDSGTTGGTDSGTTGGTDSGTTAGSESEGMTTDTGPLLDVGGMGDCAVDPCTAGESICVAGACMALYATERNTGTIDRLNPDDFSILSTAAITDAAGAVDFSSGTTGLATNPMTNELWVVAKDDAGVRHLGTIDAATGEVTIVGALSEAVAGIAFDDAGTLWGITGQGSTTQNAVFTISTVDASETLEVDVDDNPANTDGEALAFDPGTGLLYRWSGNGDPKLFSSIDPGAMVETEIPASLVTGGEVTGGVFVPGGPLAGSLLITTRAQEMVQVETDGTFTNVGNSAGVNDYYKGLAWAPAP